MKTITLLFCFFISARVIAQYQLAPEVWSIPEKIAVISEWAPRNESPSISFDGQKLYYHAGGIAAAEWADTGWAEPYGLNSNINQHLARWPIISPNGKRVFFTWFYGGWDLYYSDWDSLANDWGVAVDCGSNVNTPEWAEFTGSMPNDTTLIFLRGVNSFVSYWDSQNGTWGPSESWPTPIFSFNSDWGIYVSPTFNKVYDTCTRIDTTLTGQQYLNYDICVSYKDTTHPMGYKPAKILNICLYADTQYFAGNYTDRFEGFPTLTPDGKKMYFTATYHGQTTIYESIMLIDENGNPVGVNDDDYNLEIIPGEIELHPPYPNPFNPVTRIKYTIPANEKPGSVDVIIKVYDILGKELATLVNEEKSGGEYEVEFNSVKNSNLSSGTYIIVLKTAGTFLTRKVLLLK